jgi:hypothetical protein
MIAPEGEGVKVDLGMRVAGKRCMSTDEAFRFPKVWWMRGKSFAARCAGPWPEVGGLVARSTERSLADGGDDTHAMFDYGSDEPGQGMVHRPSATTCSQTRP